MADLRVTCVNKQPRNNTHEGITYLGGVSWKVTRQQMIDLIDNHTNTYHTLEGGKRAEVEVVRPAGRLPYVRTKADGVWRDDLLALKEC